MIPVAIKLYLSIHGWKRFGRKDVIRDYLATFGNQNTIFWRRNFNCGYVSLIERENKMHLK